MGGFSVRSGVVSVLLGAAMVAGAQPAGARTIAVSERVSLHLVRKSGSTLHQVGTASGTLPGTVSARFVVGVTRVSGSMRLTTRGGTVSITAVGTPRAAGARGKVSGSIRIVGGTGRFRGASGSGSFSAVVNRRTFASTITASGRLTY